uniref:Uncharacterized protein n=1 Tax=Glossina palpalis gambiensis TaxID=67801 RepID=A0A1B0AM77_9MUSC
MKTSTLILSSLMASRSLSGFLQSLFTLPYINASLSRIIKLNLHPLTIVAAMTPVASITSITYTRHLTNVIRKTSPTIPAASSVLAVTSIDTVTMIIATITVITITVWISIIVMVLIIVTLNKFIYPIIGSELFTNLVKGKVNELLLSAAASVALKRINLIMQFINFKL